MASTGPGVAELVERTRSGDRAAALELTPTLLDSLRAIAGRALGPAARSHTLQPTALVNEAMIRLAGAGARTWSASERTWFFAAAARAMRHALVDHARQAARAKRGGGWGRVTLSGLPGDQADVGADEIEVLAVHEAIDELERVDARAARVVELRFFAGLTEAEIARVLEVSERTVRNDWRLARALLRRRLADTPRSTPPGTEAGA